MRNALVSTGLIRRIRRERARFQGKKIGIYGGSFNPAHDGHRHIATEAVNRLGLDTVWLMVSPGNPLKSQEYMAEFEARLESAREIADHNPNLIASTIELRLETCYTSQTVLKIRKAMPKTRFVWIMGADNMALFNQWRHYDCIVRQLPIAIFDRPAYSIKGFGSVFARRYRRYQVKPSALLKDMSLPRWCFVRLPRHPASATAIRRISGLA